MKLNPVTITTIKVINPIKSDVIEEVKPIFISLEEAGLEESSADSAFDCVGLYRHADWFYDGSSAEYEV